MVIRLYTTPRLPIIDNKVALHPAPLSGVMLNQAIVYDQNSATDWYDNVSIVWQGAEAYALFDAEVTGEAVLSYLSG